MLQRALVLLALCVGATRAVAISTPAQGAVAAGGHHVLALKADGTVWSWGANDTGQLGTNDGPARGAPAPIAGLGSVAAIATGYGHSLALKIDGTVWSWGDNSSAQLGDGTQINRPTPVQIAGLTDIVAIAGGRLHSLALQSDGTLWAWGADFFRQLGDGGFMTQLRPIRITMPGPVARIVASDYASAAVLADGSVWRWGYGAGPVFPSVSVPTRVADLPFATEVALGFGHLVARTPNGDVWSVGANDSGQLGVGDSQGSAASRPNGLGGVTMLAVNTATNFALLADGSLRAWGSNIFGALGDGTKTNRLAPIPTGGAGHYVAIAAGENFAVALDDAGGVWQWGRNDAGQSGDGASQQLGRLVQVPKFDHLLGVSLTAKSGAVLKSGGTVWTLGGDAVPNLADVAAIAIGTAHSAALKSDGTVWTWGANQFGQLGDGSSTYSAVPVAVSGGSGAVAIYVGLDHSMMLKNDGSVWSWGGNNNYQLGDGTKVPRSIPVLSTVAPGAVGIGAGFGYSVAIKPDGTVARWGLNGTTVMPGLSGIVGVSAGNNHALAVKNDGTVWGWGDNTYGQLGVGNAGGYYSSGVQVPGLSGIVEVAAGATHSVARRSDGQVFAWGLNGKGALGDGSSTSRSSPVAVTPNIAARSIAAGDEVTALVRTDGTLWAAGDGVVFNWDAFALRRAAIRLVANSADVDGDGLSDAWELAHFGSLSRNGALDVDGDGLTDIRESLVGTDPLVEDTDGDGRMDSADAQPLDYYDGVAPTLAIVAGDNQVAAPGEFTPLSLDVGVWNHAGTDPLVNAPVTFAVTAGGGKLATAIGGALSDTLTLRSDSDGSVQAYFQQPVAAGVASTISVSAGQSSAEFHSTSANDEQDSDQDGLPDSWELRYFATLEFGPADQFNAMDRTLLDYYQQGIAPRWVTPVVAVGLRAWYRSGDLYFYDENSGGMKTWADLSGNGFHLRQNDPGKQPQHYSSDSGDSLVYFTEGQTLSTDVANILGDATDFTILITFRPDSPTLASREIATFGQVGSDGFQFSAANESHALNWVSAANGALQGAGIAVTATLDEPQQISVVKSGTTQTIYRNGQMVTSGTVASAPRMTPGIFTLGGAFNGGIVELQIFDRALPQTQRELAEDSLLDHAQLTDSDHNGLNDRWERHYFGHIGVDANRDSDHDGISNSEEFSRGIDPTRPDSDGDGYTDGQEAAIGSDPANPESHGVPQVTWLSRSTVTSYSEETVQRAPGLLGFRSGTLYNYKRLSVRQTVTEELPPDLAPEFWTSLPDVGTRVFNASYDADAGGVWRLSGESVRGFPDPNETTVYPLETHWHVPRAEAESDSFCRSIETSIAHPAYLHGYDVRITVTQEYTLSDPGLATNVPGQPQISTNAWTTEIPSSSRAGNNYVSTEYCLLVPPDTAATLQWLEIYPPNDDSGDKHYVGKSWTVDGEKSPVFTLAAPIENGSASVSAPFALSLATDANRDGQIDTADVTTEAEPFVFWSNDDNDQSKVYTWGNAVIPNLAPPGFISPGLIPLSAFHEQEQDDQSVSIESEKNCNDLIINGTRDLEDFARLWIDASDLRAMITGADPSLQFGLKWTDVSEGSPAIRLFRAAEATGGTGYLFIDTMAAQQIDQTGQGYGIALGSGMVDTSSTYVIPQIALANLSDSQSNIHLLFEGCRAGKGQLKLVILKQDGTEIGEGPGVWMDLKKPNEFVERFSCGDDHLGEVVPVHRHTSSATFAAPTKDEEKDYVLYVHGYNMADFEKQCWIETTYKRLFWLGYKGRVGGFTWPCSQSAPPFDASEERAWQSAAQLKTHLQNLKAEGYRVHVIAHSQGNVVMSEALRQSGPGAALVRTYVASQAAVAASAYDTGAPLMPSSGNDTPDVYTLYSPTARPYFDAADMAGAATRYVNFHNPVDYALTSASGNSFSWEKDQALKPDIGYHWSVTNGFFSGLVPFETRYTLPSDRYVIFSYCAQARSMALGAVSTGGVFSGSLNMQTGLNFGPEHIYHSAQFRSSLSKRYQYWLGLLDAALIPRLSP